MPVKVVQTVPKIAANCRRAVGSPTLLQGRSHTATINQTRHQITAETNAESSDQPLTASLSAAVISENNSAQKLTPSLLELSTTLIEMSLDAINTPATNSRHSIGFSVPFTDQSDRLIEPIEPVLEETLPYSTLASTYYKNQTTPLMETRTPPSEAPSVVNMAAQSTAYLSHEITSKTEENNGKSKLKLMYKYIFNREQIILNLECYKAF